MGSILEHHKYKEMKSKLSKMRRKGFNLGPLDTASLYILSSKDLTVNLEILRLDALSPESHCGPGYKGYAEIQEMKQRGAVKKGKLNKEDETAIEKRFETLLAETGLDKEALMEELFAANKGSPFHCNALGRRFHAEEAAGRLLAVARHEGRRPTAANGGLHQAGRRALQGQLH